MKHRLRATTLTNRQIGVIEEALRDPMMAVTAAAHANKYRSHSSRLRTPTCVDLRMGSYLSVFGAAGISSGIRCQIFSVRLTVLAQRTVTDKRGGFEGCRDAVAVVSVYFNGYAS